MNATSGVFYTMSANGKVTKTKDWREAAMNELDKIREESSFLDSLDLSKSQEVNLLDISSPKEIQRL